jgi:16S rRNA processing protein RimM
VHDKIIIGQIIGPYGIKGHVKIRSFTENPKSIFNFIPFYLDHRWWDRWPSVQSTQKDSTFIIALTDSCNHAEHYKGEKIYIEKKQLPRDNEELYYADLHGLSVRNMQGHFMGYVRAVHNFGAGDILEIIKDNENYMVSFQDIQSIQENVVFINEK